MLTRDQELWAAALWVERNHGDSGLDHIAREVERLAAEEMERPGRDGGLRAQPRRHAAAHACGAAGRRERAFVKPAGNESFAL